MYLLLTGRSAGVTFASKVFKKLSEISSDRGQSKRLAFFQAFLRRLAKNNSELSKYVVIVIGRAPSLISCKMLSVYVHECTNMVSLQVSRA